MSDVNPTIRTRFAPSPTGFVHIGSLRTALFSHLWAKHNKGLSILRIEDTDQNRKVEGAIEYLLKVMKKMGIEFDEGYYIKDDGSMGERGNFGPYLQSQRLNLYQQHAKELVDKGLAYYCFCSEQRLEEVRKEQMALKKPAMYDKHCRYLKPEQVQVQMAEFKQAGKNPVIRFAIPPEGKTVIHDLVYGTITYENQLLDDQVILKSDGFPTYHLAVVVDDHYMQITHVLRGDEWIPSTPKHLLLYQAFGWQPTQFAHLPLIVNVDKSKMSKRQGDVAVEDYLNKGYLPEALVNFVAFLGWNPKTQQEIFSFNDLVEQFDISKINKSGAVFDYAKLDWINSQYINKLQPEQLAEMLIPFWQQAGWEPQNFKSEYLAAVAKLEQQRLKKLSEAGEGSGWYFKQPAYEGSLLVWKKSTAEDTKQKLQELLNILSILADAKFNTADLETEIKNFIAEKKYDNGSVLWPLRVAMTGQEKSPGPFEAAGTLAVGYGKMGILERLKTGINKLP